jgi:hypothetical protein
VSISAIKHLITFYGVNQINILNKFLLEKSRENISLCGRRDKLWSCATVRACPERKYSLARLVKNGREMSV